MAVAYVIAVGLPTAGLAADVDDTPSDKDDFTLFNPTPDTQLRGFSSDRPPKANSPYTLDAGHFQYETDLAIWGSGNSGGVRIHQWTVLDPTFKLGLTNNVDAELQLTPYESTTARSSYGVSNASGMGDTVARLKINLVGNDHGNTSIALLPYVKIPTAARDLGNGAVESGLIIPVSFSAPAGFMITVMPQVDYAKNAGEAGYHAAYDFLFNVSHAVDKRWTVYSEVFTSQPFKTSSAAAYTLDEALTCLLRPDLQLDLGANFGLNNATPKVQMYAGVSQRF